MGSNLQLCTQLFVLCEIRQTRYHSLRFCEAGKFNESLLWTTQQSLICLLCVFHVSKYFTVFPGTKTAQQLWKRTFSMSCMETPMAVERRRCLLQMCGLMLQSTSRTFSGFTVRNTTSVCCTTSWLSFDVWTPSNCIRSNTTFTAPFYKCTTTAVEDSYFTFHKNIT